MLNLRPTGRFAGIRCRTMIMIRNKFQSKPADPGKKRSSVSRPRFEEAQPSLPQTSADAGFFLYLAQENALIDV